LIFFGALIQTIKANPQKVKLIQNIPRENDGEQHKIIMKTTTLPNIVNPIRMIY
jgi:hypothetical protein